MKASVLPLMLLAAAMDGFEFEKPVEDPLKNINIEKECQLIKQKKSKLSANQRRLVLRRKEMIGRNISDGKGVVAPGFR